MDVHDAAYRVAHDFVPDGAVGLARKLGVNPGTLLNQLNPSQETAKLGIGQAVAMSAMSGDARILHAFADSIGYLALPKPDFSKVSDSSLLEILLMRDERQGNFASSISSALADGAISESEYKEIELAGYLAAAAALELVLRLKGLCRG